MIRVEVKSGDGEEELGYGTIVREASVYVILMPDGNISSMKNAEERPSEDELPEGSIVRKVDGIPVIELDSGKTVYGCQVWWARVAPEDPEFKHSEN